MEQELAIKLQNDQIRYLKQIEIPVLAVLRRETRHHTLFFEMLYC